MIMEINKEYVIYSEEENKLVVFAMVKEDEDLIVFHANNKDFIEVSSFDEFKKRYDGSVWLSSL